MPPKKKKPVTPKGKGTKPAAAAAKPKEKEAEKENGEPMEVENEKPEEKEEPVKNVDETKEDVAEETVEVEEEETIEDKEETVAAEDEAEEEAKEEEDEGEEEEAGEEDEEQEEEEEQEEAAAVEDGGDDDDVVIVEDDEEEDNKTKETEADKPKEEKKAKLHNELGKIDKLISANQKGREIMDLARKNRIHLYPIYPQDLVDPLFLEVMNESTQTYIRFFTSKDEKGDLKLAGLLELSFRRLKDVEDYKKKLEGVREDMKVLHGGGQHAVDSFTVDWKEKSVGLPRDADSNNKLTLFAPSLPESVTVEELWDLFGQAREIWLIPGSPRQHAYIKYANDATLKTNLKELKDRGPPRPEFNFCRLVRYYDVQKVIKSQGGGPRNRRRDSGPRRSDVFSRPREPVRERSRTASKSDSSPKSKSAKDQKAETSTSKSASDKDKASSSDKEKTSEKSSEKSAEKPAEKSSSEKSSSEKSNDKKSSSEKSGETKSSSEKSIDKKSSEKSSGDKKSSSRDRSRERDRRRDRSRDRSGRRPIAARDRGRRDPPPRGDRRPDREARTRWNNPQPPPRGFSDRGMGSILGDPPHIPSLLGAQQQQQQQQQAQSLNPSLERSLNQLMQPTRPFQQAPPPQQQMAADRQPGLQALDTLLSTLGQLSQGGGGGGGRVPNNPIGGHGNLPLDDGYGDYDHRRDGGHDVRRRGRSPIKRGPSPSPAHDLDAKRRRDLDMRRSAADMDTGRYGAGGTPGQSVYAAASTTTAPPRVDEYAYGRRAPSPHLDRAGSYGKPRTGPSATGDGYDQAGASRIRSADYASIQETKGEIERMENEYARLMDQLGQTQATAARSAAAPSYPPRSGYY